MQTRSCDENENSVRLSVRRELWQNDIKICLDFYMIRKIIYPSFLWKRMVGGGRPHLPEILGQPTPVGAKSPILNRTRSASDVTPSEKSSINTNKKSTTRFSMSLRWLSYVAPKSPKGGSNTQNGRFSSKIALRLKKVCYKVFLCENC